MKLTSIVRLIPFFGLVVFVQSYYAGTNDRDHIKHYVIEPLMDLVKRSIGKEIRRLEWNIDRVRSGYTKLVPQKVSNKTEWLESKSKEYSEEAKNNFSKSMKLFNDISIESDKDKKALLRLELDAIDHTVELQEIYVPSVLDAKSRDSKIDKKLQKIEMWKEKAERPTDYICKAKFKKVAREALDKENKIQFPNRAMAEHYEQLFITPHRLDLGHIKTKDRDDILVKIAYHGSDRYIQNILDRYGNATNRLSLEKDFARELKRLEQKHNTGKEKSLPAQHIIDYLALTQYF